MGKTPFSQVERAPPRMIKIIFVILFNNWLSDQDAYCEYIVCEYDWKD
jgi:hypothetical protein